MVRAGDTLWFLRGPDDAAMAVFHGVKRHEVADVDADGRDEIVVLWRPPEAGQKARIWVVRATDSGLEYVWRGSSMSGEPVDFEVVRGAHHPRARETGKQECGICLLVTERLEDRTVETVYRWTGFGFAAAECGRATHEP